MMEPIFHDGKKSCVGDKKNLETEQNECFVMKILYQLNIKKKLTNIILEGKKPMRKNVVAIDNVLWGNYSVFPNTIDKDTFRKNHKKSHLEKYWQCFVRKTTKSIKIILEKIMWENTATIHSVLKKKITKLNSQSD